MNILHHQYSRDSDNDVFKRMYESIRADTLSLKLCLRRLINLNLLNC